MAQTPLGWVPVERRVLGIDKATIAPALVVLALAVLLSFGVPALDDAVAEGAVARADDRIALRDGYSFSPSAGWTITDGVLADDEARSGSPATASITDGAASFEANVVRFTGTPGELLDLVADSADLLRDSWGYRVIGDPVSVQTGSGVRGARAEVSGVHVGGFVAAFTDGESGLVITALGPETGLSSHDTSAIETMLDSISDGEDAP